MKSYQVIRRQIILENFETLASIGIHEHERAAPQRLVFNIVLTVDTACPEQDHIEEVLDYDFLRTGIIELIEARHYNLQESLCRDIVDLCFSRAQVSAVEVSSRKTDVYEDCAAIGYRIEAHRTEQ
ncbi:dihydroneopterin aldolase [Emcibacter sp.]|uniref:dihydroneopterin aldolase n=1 Tax=Emcibacter sp. TaxID=1979954 RepID=UPI003A93F6B1